MNYPEYRDLAERIRGRATRDGAGVRLTRIIGGGDLRRFDPFLMLDRFDSLNPDDFIAGFPPHPHRGFETITLMFAGRMEHEDHLGHRGLIGTDGMQWMTAARGIIHSEMPKVDTTHMSGVQLWLNLPAAAKMGPAAYRDYDASEIPECVTGHGVHVRVLAGEFHEGSLQCTGVVCRPHTCPQILDLQMPAGSCVQPEISRELQAMLLPLSGELTLQGSGAHRLQPDELALLGQGDRLHLQAGSDSRVLLLAGRPLHEPIVQYGPFVMNTRAEIEQALDDYRNGRFG